MHSPMPLILCMQRTSQSSVTINPDHCLNLNPKHINTREQFQIFYLFFFLQKIVLAVSESE